MDHQRPGGGRDPGRWLAGLLVGQLEQSVCRSTLTRTVPGVSCTLSESSHTTTSSPSFTQTIPARSSCETASRWASASRTAGSSSSAGTAHTSGVRYCAEF
jgi:hypothetical protein